MPNLHPAADHPCDSHRACITCSDEGVPMRVVELDPDEGLAVCADDSGRSSEVMTALVSPVAIGDRLLVHAGTALARLETIHPPEGSSA